MRGLIFFVVGAALAFSVTRCISLDLEVRQLKWQIITLNNNHARDITGLAKAIQANSAGINSNTRSIQILAASK